MSRLSIRRRAGADFLERIADLIDAQALERAAAYAAGYDTGYPDGLEAGLRALLDDARLALGWAA